MGACVEAVWGYDRDLVRSRSQFFRRRLSRNRARPRLAGDQAGWLNGCAPCGLVCHAGARRRRVPQERELRLTTGRGCHEPERLVWRPMVLFPTNLLHLCAPVRLVRTEREFRLATGCGQSELAVSEPEVWLASRSIRALSIIFSALARESLAPAAPGKKRGLGVC